MRKFNEIKISFIGAPEEHFPVAGDLMPVQFFGVGQAMRVVSIELHFSPATPGSAGMSPHPALVVGVMVLQ